MTTNTSTQKLAFPKLNIFPDILLLLSGFVLFFPLFYRLNAYGWKNAEYDHGIFILPITAVLIFLKINQLTLSQTFSYKKLAIFLGGTAFYLFFYINDFLFFQAFGFVWVFASIFHNRLTAESFRKILFPLTYLVFLIPPPGLVLDTLTSPMKTISTIGAYFMIKAMGIPVIMKGVILTVDKQDLFVTDACSGFRSMSTLLALGSLYIYFQKFSKAKKIALFLMIIPLGIIGNMLRIALTGLIVFIFGSEYAVGTLHELFGGLVFLVTIAGLMGMTHLFNKMAARENE